MSVEEVTTESWGSRLGNSFKGIVVGGVLFLAGIPLLFWNEGRAVKTAKALEEGESVCKVVPSNETVDSQNEGKLIHITGNAVTQTTLTDDVIPGISLKAMKLSRSVEYYQWVEHESTREEKQVGGSVKKRTTYNYSKEWVSEPVNSSEFKEAGHDNVVHFSGVEDKKQCTESVSFGAFVLTQDQIGSIGGYKPVDLKDVPMPPELTGRTTVSGNMLYIGAPAGPVMMPLPAGMEPGVATALSSDTYVEVESYPGKKLPVFDDPTCGALVQGPTGDLYPLGVDEQNETVYILVNNGPRYVTGEGDITTAPPAPAVALPGLINVDRLGVLPVFYYGDKVYVRTQDNRMLLIKPWQDHYIVSNNGVMLRAHINLNPAAAATGTATVNPGAPEVGDVRISWTYVPDTMPISIVSCQQGNTFTPYVAENGYTVDLLQMGTKSKEVMFQSAKDSNTMWTWILRFVGWLMMYMGLKMILAPLSVLADVLPILGNIVGMGTGIIAFFVSSIVALVVIAIAWLFYRPVLGIVLLAAAIGLVVMLIKKKKQAAPAPAPEAAE